MSVRINRVNALIQQAFGEILQREADVPPNALVTVSRVETTRNLRSTKIWLSVYPESLGDAVLTTLQGSIYDLQGALNRRVTFYPLPRIYLFLDHGAEHAEQIERRLKELDND